MALESTRLQIHKRQVNAFLPRAIQSFAAFIPYTISKTTLTLPRQISLISLPKASSVHFKWRKPLVG